MNIGHPQRRRRRRLGGGGVRQATRRLFVRNVAANSIDIIDISNPAAPEKVGEFDLLAYGASPSSVAAHKGVGRRRRPNAPRFLQRVNRRNFAVEFDVEETITLMSSISARRRYS